MSISEGILLAFLGLNTVSDIRYKKIVVWSAWLFGIFGIAYGLLAQEVTLIQILISLIPGIIFLAISKATKESLGYGDGIIVLVMGSYIGISKLVGSLVLALIFAAIWSIVLLVFFRKKKQEEFPFVPFVLLGYLGGLLI